MDARSLQDRVALITGSGSGLGRATAIRFAAEGADVIVADIDLEAARATVATIAEAGGTAEAYQVDVTNAEQLRGLVAYVDETRGALHILFNNAGLEGTTATDIESIEDAAWQLIVDVNLRGPFYLTSYALPLLRKAVPHASVIFTSSSSGLVGSRHSIAYSATKGGVVLMVKSLADRLGPEGIRVNAVCPGPSDTPMPRRIFEESAAGQGDAAAGEEYLQAFVSSEVPLGRLARPEEIAAAALFLASDESSFVTGVALPVDGGLTAR